MLTFLLLSQIAFASPAAPRSYAFDVEVTRGGKEALSRQNVALLEGESGEVTEDKTFVELVAREELPNQAIHMDFAVGTIDADGKKIVEARPVVVAQAGKVATVTVTEKTKDAKHEPLTVSVTARPE